MSAPRGIFEAVAALGSQRRAAGVRRAGGEGVPAARRMMGDRVAGEIERRVLGPAEVAAKAAGLSGVVGVVEAVRGCGGCKAAQRGLNGGGALSGEGQMEVV